MRYATFTAEVKKEKMIQLPSEVFEKLRIEPGDCVEISLKKIKTGKLDIFLSENPLYRLLDISKSAKRTEAK